MMFHGCGAFIKGASAAVNENFVLTVSYMAVYGLLYMLVAYTLHRLFIVMGRFPRHQRQRASFASLGALTAMGSPILYLTFNSAACLMFVESSLENCGMRVCVNSSAIISLAISAILPAYFTFVPISLARIASPQLSRDCVGAQRRQRGQRDRRDRRLQPAHHVCGRRNR